MKRHYFTLAIVIAFCCQILAQPNYTANDVIKPYDGVFRAGVNFDIYPGFSDQDLASLAAGVDNVGVAGVGVKALRPSLPESFLEQYGYDIRLDAFKFYDSLGLKDNTLIVGFPSEVHRDPTFYCPTEQSTVFKNMYEPIWDNGENGTPVNDNNYMALYVWKLVQKYGKYIKFYEIWNEPGFDFTGNLGWREPGDPAGNWWDRNPAPCEYKLRAPIQNYIRILRIAYEVIKTADPNAYVTTSGLGYASFMDAILRNTDNPDNGKVTAQYPFGAGAYIDGIGYHSYPHFDDALRNYNVQRGAFDYYRHSDAAGIDPARTKELYDKVLRKYGYDGIKYPKKNYIITEANLPRKQFGDYIGSSEAQKNWIIKAYINCVQNDIWQMHIFKIAEETTYDGAGREFDVMGLYQKFDANNRYGAIVNDEGIAYATTSKILFNKKYDAGKTASMNLPSTIGGGAFKGSDGKYTYVIWAKTTVDLSEAASAVYSFPNGITSATLTRQNWDWFKTKFIGTASTQNIALNATPIFLTEGSVVDVCTNDIQPPTFSNCPQDIQLNTAGTSVNATWLTPTATDNCTAVTLTSNYNSGATFNVGTTNVLYTAVDAKGNKSTCSFNITVTQVANACDNDIIAPVFANCPQNINLTSATNSVTATWTAPTATDNCSTPTVTSNYNSGASFNQGITTVIYTATDAKGNKAVCSFTVTLSPQTSGALCKRYTASSTTNICGCDVSRNQPYGMFIESANVCPGTLFPATSDVVFQMFNDGTGTIKGTFTDPSGQTVVADIKLSGGTTTPPTGGSPYLILCQFGKPASVAAGWNYFPNLNGTLKFGSNAPVTVVRRNESVQVGVGANGQNTDKLGLSGAFLTSDGKNGDFKLVLSNEQTITCAGSGNACDSDSIPPAFTGCPQNIVVTTAGISSSAIWAAPLATDNCGTPTVSSNYNPGANFNLGSTTVTYTAVDAKNNKGTCTFTVTVSQQVTGASNCKKYIGTNALNYCGCAESRLHPYGMFIESANICPGNLLQADQDIIFQLNTDGTATLKGTFRDSTWKPYLVDIIFSGGTTTPPAGSPNLYLCQTGKPASVANGWQYFTSMTGTVKYANNPAQTISRRGESAQVGLGANTQILDQLGLSAPFILSDGTKGDFKLSLANEQIVACGAVGNSCDNDTQAPVFNTCPQNITITTFGTTGTATWSIPIATDNCSATVSLTGNYLSGASFPIGNTTITYTAADAKNNKATCSFVVTVMQQTGGGGGSDLAVSISSSLTNFKQYTPADFRITVKNLGTTTFNDVKISLTTPTGLVGGNTAVVSSGIWQIYCPGGLKCSTWAIPSIAGGATLTMDVSFYVLDVTTPIVATATLTASTPTDTNTTNNQASITLAPSLKPIEPTALISPYQSVAIQKIAPNPTLDDTEIQIVSIEAQSVNFVFYNSVGTIIRTETRQLEQGLNRVYFDASELSPGIYYVSPVTKDNRTVPTKFVKM